MSEVAFRALYPWAIVPKKVKIDPKPKQDEARLMEENFLWVRTSRSAELCWPWRMSQEIGWVIESPVTVQMDALHDIEAICPPEALRQGALLTNATENWSFAGPDGKLQRVHFTRKAGWIALYDFRGKSGNAERMFYINGQGVVEWTTGWEMTIPSTHSIMIVPYGNIPNLEVLVGVLPAASLVKRVGHANGVSVAVRPTGPVSLQRGQPFARVILLHPDSLRMNAETEGEAGTATENEKPS